MNRLLFDVFAALILGVTAVIGAYAPVVLMARARAQGGATARSMAYVLGNMLSAGVMVSAGFCHLLADALEAMPASLSFPLAPFLAGVGFLLTLVADAVASSTAGGHNHCGPEPAAPQLPAPAAPKDPSLVGSASGPDLAAAGYVPAMTSDAQDARREDATLLSNGALPSHIPFDVEAATATAVATAPPQKPRVAFVTAVLMGVALCFHSVLEGAALGAQTTISSSAHIFIAIVSHKGLAAYALGSSIVDSNASVRKFWSVILPFTLASPIGIFVGYIISDLAAGTGAASISALAAGTFLYVAFMEVIPKELRGGGNTTLKLLFLVLGYGLMSLLAIWA